MTITTEQFVLAGRATLMVESDSALNPKMYATRDSVELNALEWSGRISHSDALKELDALIAWGQACRAELEQPPANAQDSPERVSAGDLSISTESQVFSAGGGGFALDDDFNHIVEPPYTPLWALYDSEAEALLRIDDESAAYLDAHPGAGGAELFFPATWRDVRYGVTLWVINRPHEALCLDLLSAFHAASKRLAGLLLMQTATRLPIQQIEADARGSE